MDVRMMVTRIVELSHHAGNADVDLQSKALGWVNAAYQELMDELVPYLPQALQVQEEGVCSGAGKLVLSKPVYRLIRVVDREAGRSLRLSNRDDVLVVDPEGTATGEPVRVFIDAGRVQVHPAMARKLAVLYVPMAADLLMDDAEAAVLLPRVYHHALIWGGLVWSAVFERGFLSQGEQLLYQRQWAAAKEQVKLGLLGNVGESMRVRPYRYV
ncbi:MAG: hypothetical protein COY40_04615 [Alphaproteobacteria bacterium CG_4_10_14_0_8_um_filter_53_9]|nr:MAG: hypothetical protein COY40_04615 [Alphaproteobacteria bacterium CG_4_10_14_0_8_um_filter_53_9]